MDARLQRHALLIDRVRNSANPEHVLLLLVWERCLAPGWLGDSWLLSETEWFVRKGYSQYGVGDAVFVNRQGKKALVLEVKKLHEVRQGRRLGLSERCWQV